MMKFFRTSPAQTFADWFDIATKGISSAARERISVEICAHYAESVKARLADGLSEAEALTAALAELGDAKLARKRFRRRHLTESEAKLLLKMRQSAGTRSPLLRNYFIFAAFIAIAAVFRMPWEKMGLRDCILPFLLTDFVLLIVLPTKSFIEVCHFKKEPNLRRSLLSMFFIILFHIIILIVLNATVIRLILWKSSALSLPTVAMLFFLQGGMFLRSLWFLLHLWRKLKYVAGPWNQLPPADTDSPPSLGVS